MPLESIDERLSKRAHISNNAIVRTIVAPERREELGTPVELGSEDFAKSLYELGHAGGTPLFSYTRQKSHHIVGQAIIVEQT